MGELEIAGKRFHSRLFLGTGKFSSPEAMIEAVQASGSEMVTVSLRRFGAPDAESDLVHVLLELPLVLLPNTSGARDASEAVLASELAREALGTDWIKLEIHPNPNHLMPDPVETLQAAAELVKRGFIVLPYVHADPVICKRLEDVGVAAVMPLAAPIGSNAGLQARTFLEIIISQSNVPVIVDAGLGVPSHAGQVMELGADAVLVNTAIATSRNPTRMAQAFRKGVEAGRDAFCAGAAYQGPLGQATSPNTALLHKTGQAA